MNQIQCRLFGCRIHMRLHPVQVHYESNSLLEVSQHRRKTGG
jgi:hypothetical protein